MDKFELYKEIKSLEDERLFGRKILNDKKVDVIVDIKQNKCVMKDELQKRRYIGEITEK